MKWGEEMSAEVPATPRRRERGRWRQWLQLFVAAGVLLALSEALWVWQTWPVRELLQAPATRTAGR
jgi:hypothetical protein